ncbi:MAG TPA: hypothetical protein VFK15_03765 [Burkholderiales bacterium]|nr:hypothetical protein [Burkholderiales bacterium]
MDTRNLTRADIRYIDELCLDEGAVDAGDGLENALEQFSAHHGINPQPGEIYKPTADECAEIARLAVDSILGGTCDA